MNLKRYCKLSKYYCDFAINLKKKKSQLQIFINFKSFLIKI